MTVSPRDRDPGEQILSGIEEASGFRPDTCPWQAFRDPFTLAVLRAHKHWSEGQLTARIGPHVPEALMRGIEIYDAALNSVKLHDIREEREERERKRKHAEATRGLTRFGGRRG